MMSALAALSILWVTQEPTVSTVASSRVLFGDGYMFRVTVPQDTMLLHLAAVARGKIAELRNLEQQLLGSIWVFPKRPVGGFDTAVQRGLTDIRVGQEGAAKTEKLDSWKSLDGREIRVLRVSGEADDNVLTVAFIDTPKVAVGFAASGPIEDGSPLKSLAESFGFVTEQVRRRKG